MITSDGHDSSREKLAECLGIFCEFVPGFWLGNVVLSDSQDKDYPTDCDGLCDLD
jgi:hypothetical protein